MKRDITLIRVCDLKLSKSLWAGLLFIFVWLPQNRSLGTSLEFLKARSVQGKHFTQFNTVRPNFNPPPAGDEVSNAKNAENITQNTALAYRANQEQIDSAKKQLETKEKNTKDRINELTEKSSKTDSEKNELEKLNKTLEEIKLDKKTLDNETILNKQTNNQADNSGKTATDRAKKATEGEHYQDLAEIKKIQGDKEAAEKLEGMSDLAKRAAQAESSGAGSDNEHAVNLDQAKQENAGILKDLKPFDGLKESTPVEPAKPPAQPPPPPPLEPQSLTGGNPQLQTMNAINEGRAAAGPEFQAKMDEMASRANDTSLSGSINGRSNDGYQSNEGFAFVNGESVKGRYFDDVHGGGRYFVPDSAYGRKGLDGYMAARNNDLSGLHQLNGSIASGNATRVGNNIQFDGFYNGNQTVKNGVWNAPANGAAASRTNIPFSSSNQVAARQAPAVTSSVNTGATGARTTASASVGSTQSTRSGFFSRIGRFFFGRRR